MFLALLRQDSRRYFGALAKYRQRSFRMPSRAQFSKGFNHLLYNDRRIDSDDLVAPTIRRFSKLCSMNIAAVLDVISMTEDAFLALGALADNNARQRLRQRQDKISKCHSVGPQTRRTQEGGGDSPQASSIEYEYEYHYWYYY